MIYPILFISKEHCKQYISGGEPLKTQSHKKIIDTISKKLLNPST